MGQGLDRGVSELDVYLPVLNRHEKDVSCIGPIDTVDQTRGTTLVEENSCQKKEFFKFTSKRSGRSPNIGEENFQTSSNGSHGSYILVGAEYILLFLPNSYTDIAKRVIIPNRV